MHGPLFKKIDFDVDYIVSAIDQGTVGLPDIQRPFVWSSSKVRDLFDSMYRGYPVGYFMLWAAYDTTRQRQIGNEHGTDLSTSLIIDGQQRLTSLYTVMKGKPVFTDKFEEKLIKIAFHPLKEAFAVSTAAHQRSHEWIENISTLFSASTSSYTFIGQYIENLAKEKELTEEDKSTIARNIDRLMQLKKYPFSAIEISGDADEEDVADIFVRVNSQGQKLNQADFILTLISVFWEEGREHLESFCKNARIPNIKETTSYNYLFAPDPDHLLRVSIGYAFKRARLKYAYLVLRGKDLETKETSADLREKQFEIFKEAQEKSLNLQNWHDFLKIILNAGYKRSNMIVSYTAIIYTYVFYLIGKYDFKIESSLLRKILSKWFFMTTLTYRYSSSAETQMEQDLANLRSLKTADEFVAHLEQIIKSVLTNDYWSITLPQELVTSSPNSPIWKAYTASLNLLKADVLFSTLSVSDLLDPTKDANKSALERHHLFPKKYLETIGITDDRERNQIANFAYVEWRDNLDILDDAPSVYIGEYIDRLNEDKRKEIYYYHALPEQWHTLEYKEFLEQRRKMMAQVIKDAFEKL
ncbi:MAG TPA: DUF262 domain-containing protein [Sulfurovum sp.]|uniref:GmrSD restriction endonuclease domain-containing protein n=1 Tax=Sulfurovum sp. TaxID=1969726 RepID=UPI002F922676